MASRKLFCFHCQCRERPNQGGVYQILSNISGKRSKEWHESINANQELVAEYYIMLLVRSSEPMPQLRIHAANH